MPTAPTFNPEAARSVALLADNLTLKGENEELYAKLWSIKPKEYGANKETIDRCWGRSETYKNAVLVAKLNQYERINHRQRRARFIRVRKDNK